MSSRCLANIESVNGGTCLGKQEETLSTDMEIQEI